MNREQLKEQIAKRIAIWRGLIAWDNLPIKQTQLCGCACQEACLRGADLILSLEPLATLLNKLDETREICPHCAGTGLRSPRGKNDKCCICLGSGLGDWHPEKLEIRK